MRRRSKIIHWDSRNSEKTLLEETVNDLTLDGWQLVAATESVYSVNGTSEYASLTLFFTKAE